MKVAFTICALAQLLTTSNAGNTCQKDACYNIVARDGSGKPNLNSRKADCSSILRTVVDQDITTTVTRTTTAAKPFTTVFSKTIATSSVTVTSTNLYPDRAVFLEARDKFVIKGTKPAYATACAQPTDYALACLCYGIKPGQQKTQTRVITQFQTTYTVTISATTSVIATQTATTTVPCTKDVQNDRQNCGSCGNVCSTGDVCRSGYCAHDECRVADSTCDGEAGSCPSGISDSGCNGGKCFNTYVGNRCLEDFTENRCSRTEPCEFDGQICVVAGTCLESDFCAVARSCPNLSAGKRGLVFGA